MLVCKHWTEVALNTPVLWSRITVSNHDSLIKARRKLSRSKSVPLDICVQFSPRMDHSGATTESLIHAMDILRPSIWRWRSFRLAVPNRPQAHAALMQCREAAPILEDLSVQIFHFMQDDYYSTPPLPLFAGHTPRLRMCSFTSFNFGWDPSLASKLRVLKLGGYWHGFSPSVETILGILRACPALEELALRNMSDIDPDSCADFGFGDGSDPEYPGHFVETILPQKNTEMITLPRLKKAAFYYAGVVRVQAVLAQLSFPSLERVEFMYLDNITGILKHLKRQSFSSLPLRHLRVESSFFNELKLIKLLRRLPSLHTLELVDVEDVSSNFLKGLSNPPTAQSWICPKLETLNLDGCTTVDWDALRSLVESRLPASSSRMLNVASAAAFPQGNPMLRSTASSYAEARRNAPPISKPDRPSPFMLGMPKRFKTIDLTRCHQISKEMLQWLRMYVAEVRCESAKSFWGEPAFP
ncbi:hypothetical protein BD410DRAFT_721536 [Rickenella mellea]|uniref:F-box domain-containing protein n=1 Tax=Rickenella mellea TaxID=50990 RepID=A0A4Y7Q8U1_9AGAM|nr:hypothetical protein BD410DRAFT_721536 [Rickenella mellea]